MNLLSLLGPLQRFLGSIEKSRHDRNEKLENIRKIVDRHKADVSGYCSSIQNHQSPYRITCDVDRHHRSMAELLDSQIFWKFCGGQDYKRRLLEFNMSYTKLQSPNSSQAQFIKDANDFIDQANIFSGELLHKISE